MLAISFSSTIKYIFKSNVYSPSPATVGMTIPTDPADQAANESQAKKQLNLDTTKPITTIQIRLADGSSVRAQFNLTHTISDLRRYITTYPLVLYIWLI